MTEFLIFLGTIFLIVLVVGVIWALYAGFKELIDKAVWRYRYKYGRAREETRLQSENC